MDIFYILLRQIMLFVVYMAVGVIVVKTKVLNERTLETISRFVIKAALPVMIFINTVNGVDVKLMLQASSIWGAALIMYLLIYFLSSCMARGFHIKGETARVYRAACLFGNVGFMGIPIIASIFPEEGMLYVTFFTVLDQFMLWTLGLRLMTPLSDSKQGVEIKKFINPATTAIVLALLMVVFRIPMPGVLNEALTKIGGTATPLAMIYLGGVFACIDIRKYIGKIELYGTVIIKMILFPVVFFGILGFLPLQENVRLTITFISGLPTMSAAVMMARSSGSDGDFAVGAIFITTICSILTLPLVSLLINYIY